MTQVVDAIFQNGAFRPLEPMNTPLAEGQNVRLVVETEAGAQPDVLELAANVYRVLSRSEINEIEAIALDRRNFFGDEAR